MEIKLSGYNWFSDSFTYVRGYCFDSCGELLIGSKLLEYFANASDETMFLKRLSDANGIFSVVINKSDFKAIAIDRSRIYPLYYSTGESTIITDDPHLLLNKSSNLDNQSVEEYLCSGAVFAGKTLVKGVMSVKPSHYIVFEQDSHREIEYWNYCTKIGCEVDCSLEQLDSVFEKVFTRTAAMVGNRQVVVPLSGGLDSRLIVCWLKRLKIENVVCYTIGRPGNSEYATAKKVTDKLGYKHYFIDNTSTDFVPADYFKDADFQRYCHFIGSLGNFLWVFEYFAVKWMKEKKLITSDAVFMPGHTADFFAGSQLVKALVTHRSSVKYLTNAIMFDCFEYHRLSSSVRDEVKAYFTVNKDLNISAHTNYMSFIIQNRLAHQINNSARLYEFFGHEVCLPFWDKELLDLFKALPYKKLEKCSFYVEYVSKLVFSKLGVDFPRTGKSKFAIIRQKLKNRLKPFIPKVIAHKFVSLHDDICECELTAPMVKELVDSGIYANKYQFLSYNEVMRDWYLQLVHKKVLGSIYTQKI